MEQNDKYICTVILLLTLLLYTLRLHKKETDILFTLLFKKIDIITEHITLIFNHEIIPVQKY